MKGVHDKFLNGHKRTLAPNVIKLSKKPVVG